MFLTSTSRSLRVSSDSHVTTLRSFSINLIWFSIEPGLRIRVDPLLEVLRRVGLRLVGVCRRHSSSGFRTFRAEDIDHLVGGLQELVESRAAARACDGGRE